MTDTRDKSESEGAFARITAVWPYALAALLFGFGLYALYHMLAPIRLSDVLAQVRATHWATLALALLTTLGGYLSLVGYDWSALRFIGKPLPLPVTITGGLMAYAFGNTIGLSAVSGGAVRYRIYSGLGLDGYDVAAVSTFAAVSFGVAATVVGLGALALHPGALGALSPMPPPLLGWAALGAILLIVMPLVWASVGQHSVRLGRFTLRAPTLRVLLGQLVFSLGDIGFSALTLYLLMPSAGLEFGTFLAIFAAATLAGIISHVPGGVGVFETVVIAALPPHIPVEQAAAALLLYRMTYYLVPFIIALVVLAFFETTVILRGARAVPDGRVGRLMLAVAPALRAVSPLAPLALAAMIFGSGALMSFSALIPAASPAAEALESLFPLAFAEGSSLACSALGAGMIVLALGVSRRSMGAYLLALVCLAGAVVVALVQGFDVDRALTLVLAIVILLPFRREFHRRAALVHGAFSPVWFLLIAALILSVCFVLFFAHRGTPYAADLWWQFAADERAPQALRAGLVGALTVGIATLILLLRTPRLHPAPATPEDIARAAGIVADQAAPHAALALTGDKSLLFSDDGRAFIMFAVQGRSWVALGAPIGPADAAYEIAWVFTDAARRAGARPVFYEVSEGNLPLMLDLGLSLQKLCGDAVITLSGFDLEGPQRRRLRATHARALRDGLTLEVMAPPHAPDLIAALRGVSDEWLDARHMREKHFSVGRFDPAWLDRWPVAVVRDGRRQAGQVVAFANLMVTGHKSCVAVDLMRHADAAPPGTMEFLFTETMMRLKADGYGALSMGMAPLSGLENRAGTRLWARIGAAIFEHGGRFYGFRGLRSFKEKFDPDWLPHYLAVPSSALPLLPLADAALLIGGGAKGVLPH